MSLPQLRLENQLCFLVYRLEHRITQLYRALLEPLGVTYPQYLALLVLWHEEELGVASLAQELHLDTGTVSPLLKRMERAGLVKRARSRADERSVLVSLTPKGRALEQKAAGIPAALVSCLGGGSVEEGAAFAGSLRSLLESSEGRNRT
jgi:MarR family transcriptional regulator, organic hydroperoxide resistance regulator